MATLESTKEYLLRNMNEFLEQDSALFKAVDADVKWIEGKDAFLFTTVLVPKGLSVESD